MSHESLIEAAWDDRSLLGDAASAVEETVAALDRGEIRIAAPGPTGHHGSSRQYARLCRQR